LIVVVVDPVVDVDPVLVVVVGQGWWWYGGRW
jgi:hypothetical protein